VVGFLFALTATLALLVDATAVFTVAVSFALAAAFLNAVFNFCLGCEMYLRIARIRNAISKRKTPEDSYNLPNL
jgi:ribosomal protein S26